MSQKRDHPPSLPPSRPASQVTPRPTPGRAAPQSPPHPVARVPSSRSSICCRRRMMALISSGLSRPLLALCWEKIAADLSRFSTLLLALLCDSLHAAAPGHALSGVLLSPSPSCMQALSTPLLRDIDASPGHRYSPTECNLSPWCPSFPSPSYYGVLPFHHLPSAGLLPFHNLPSAGLLPFHSHHLMNKLH